MGRLKRKAKKGETPSPQECKKHNTMQSLNESNGSDTDHESDENWPGNLDIQNKSDRQLLQEVWSKLCNVVSEIRTVNKKQDKIMKKLKDMETKLTQHDKDIKDLKQEHEELKDQVKHIDHKKEDFDPDVTLVAINTPFFAGEDTFILAQHILQAGGSGDKEIVNTLRTKQRNGRNGILKIELKSKQDKIDVLKKKSNLKQSTEFKRVYLRSSKSHSERLLEVNIKTLLSEIPNGTQYRVAGNGRLVKKDFPSAQQPVSHHVPTSASLQQSQSKTDTQDITSPMSQAMTYSSVLQTPPTNGQPSSYRQSSITDWASQSAGAQGVSSSSQWQLGAKTKTSSQDSRRTYTSPTSVTYK